MQDEILLAQAMYKALGNIVSTKSENSLRAQDDKDLIELYETTGAKTFDRKVNGVKVGTSTIKIQPAKDVCDLTITDKKIFDKWLLDTGIGKTQVVFDEKNLYDYIAETGEEPQGAKIHLNTIPQHVSGTVLKIDTEKVFDAMADVLPQNVAALLEQGD